jgi:hypothetical protein
VDRKEFLKSGCVYGVCGCALSLLGVLDPSAAADTPPPAAETPPADQRLAFVKYQLAKMLGFMEADAPVETYAGILEKTGRECAKLGQLQVKFKGDPEGYFAAAKSAWGADFTWDKEKGVITIAAPEGECACPLVDSQRTPAIWCNCAVGYQKETLETVFGRPIASSLKESKLSGSKRCVFEVTLG